MNKDLDYKLKMFRKGVSDINIERLGSHAMGDAVKDAEELFRNATRDISGRRLRIRLKPIRRRLRNARMRSLKTSRIMKKKTVMTVNISRY